MVISPLKPQTDRYYFISALQNVSYVSVKILKKKIEKKFRSS